MKKTVYVIGYLVIAGVISGLFRLYILDNMWIDSLLSGILIAYGLSLYNKKFGKQPVAQ